MAPLHPPRIHLHSNCCPLSGIAASHIFVEKTYALTQRDIDTHIREHDIAELDTRLQRGEGQSNGAFLLPASHNGNKASPTTESIIIIIKINQLQCQVPQRQRYLQREREGEGEGEGAAGEERGTEAWWWGWDGVGGGIADQTQGRIRKDSEKEVW